MRRRLLLIRRSASSRRPVMSSERPPCSCSRESREDMHRARCDRCSAATPRTPSRSAHARRGRVLGARVASVAWLRGRGRLPGVRPRVLAHGGARWLALAARARGSARLAWRHRRGSWTARRACTRIGVRACRRPWLSTVVRGYGAASRGGGGARATRPCAANARAATRAQRDAHAQVAIASESRQRGAEHDPGSSSTKEPAARLGADPDRRGSSSVNTGLHAIEGWREA